MPDRSRRFLLLMLVFAPAPVSIGCRTMGVSEAKAAPARSDQPANTASLQQKPEEAALPKDQPSDVGDPLSANVSASKPVQFEGPAYQIRYKAPSDTLYLVIENNFTDRGGVPPLLSFTTSIDDKRTIIQSPAPEKEESGGAVSASAADGVSVKWQFDRYEARERGIKDEVKFDSLRDTYARAEIRELGAIPGASVIFEFNPRTGAADRRRITPNRQTGPVTRRRLSRTAARCALNEANLAKLMDDLGPLFLPARPVHVGESWTQTRSDTVKSFGETFFDYQFTLKSVQERDGRQIATIDVTGRTRLVPETPNEPEPARGGAAVKTPSSKPAASSSKAAVSEKGAKDKALGPVTTPEPVATTRPSGASATTQKAKSSKPKDFRIDKSVCRGTIEFDLTGGTLVSMDLLRELDLSAGMESDEFPGMRLETGSAHRLRVRVLSSPPPKPVIADGPRPPADDPPEPNTPASRKNRFRQPTRPTTRPAPRYPTTWPAGGGSKFSTTQPTSRPVRQPTSQPVLPPRSVPMGPPVPPEIIRQRLSRPAQFRPSGVKPGVRGTGSGPARPAKRVPASQPSRRVP